MNTEEKAKLIERIKTINGLEDEERSSLLELLRTKKSYGLVWENKPENVEEELRDKLPVLVEDKDKSLTDASPGAPNHVLIEGDNLEALTTLAFTHAGKVDVIYIDPPYNTGKKDEFKYNDSFIDKDNPYRHSFWLSFMSKRLKIAKRLLSDSGVIFISIDDHEFGNLKSLCDEIFSDNFLQNFVWYTEGHTDNQDDITDVHEYILCYSKRGITPEINNVVDPNVDENSKILRDFAENSITKNGKKNPPSIVELPIGFPCEIESLYLPVSDNIEEFLSAVKTVGYITRDLSASFSMKYPVRLDEMKVENFALAKPCRVFSGWMNNAKLQKFIENDCRPVDDNDTSLKFYLSKNGVVYYRREGRQSHYVQSILMGMGTTETNKYMLERMNIDFDYPKPIELIRYLLSLYSKKDSIILDFFAGSATTIHSTFILNEEDDGHRKCILVTNNENNICTDIAYKRIEYIINHDYTSSDNSLSHSHSANKLRYYKTELLDKDNSHTNRRALFMALTDVLCFKEDIYHEEFQFGDLSLSGKSKMLRYFAEGDRKMLIIYDSRVIKFIVNEISKLEKAENPIKVFIYADGMYPYTEDFQDVLDRIELIPMPYAFTHAVKGCIPEPTEQRVDQTELSQKEQQALLTEASEAENKDI